MGKKFKGGKRIVPFTSPSLSFKSTAVEIAVHERNSSVKPRVNWLVGGHPFYSTDAHKLYEELKHSVKRTTIYELCDDGDAKLRLCSPEHLAPVFLMWPSRSFDIDLLNAEEPEVPMMDGSALPFFSKIRRAAGVPEELSFYDAPVRAEWNIVRDGAVYGHVRIEPSEAFEVEYKLTSLDSYASVAIYSAEDLYSLFMARTFITESEYSAARAAGLLEGVDESCGLLLSGNADDREKFRVCSEPAMHKILDLIGDIAFVCPSLPKLRIEILNGGHVAHHQIVEKLLPYVSLNVAPQV